ncbi:hypothetical protein N657DRAFT_662923 [Parathielavia appendiculata]|uniref:Alcohol dehydrogenase-like C-terminal domain-containing protein n=1 Tax=Parathielavia appendiculata TaxID=2587402 RepID=A0AAN6Z4G8_9PEZI|nr:hypothetical protein N657DRAFT_662923 [Parathielavia appendiculata]
MPSRANSTTVAPTGTAKPKRFELPALDLKLGSLTDGTDIPPPLPSPIQEKAGPTPPDTPKIEQPRQEDAGATNGTLKMASPHSQLSNISTTGTKRRAEDSLTSPTLSNRPGSIRRLFSRGLLNTAYANGDDAALDRRPQSRGTASVADSRKAKRSSGWFGRLRSNEALPSKPVTPLSPPATDDRKPTGPPPPTIPELSELKSKLGIQNDDRSIYVAHPRRYKSGPYGYTQAKTLVFSRFGEPRDVLRLHTHSISPTLPDGAVLVRALAAPINPADVNTIQGTYGAKPAFDQQLPLGTPEPAAVPGNEGCFEVVAVGGVIQLGRLWGLRSVNVIRERATPEETEALKKELTELGATVVITESEFLDRSFTARLKEEWTRGGKEPVMLGLNCVGGKSAAAMVKALSPKGCMVTYGGMSRQSFPFPTGPQIFKRLRFEGFWLSEWGKENPLEKRNTVNEILDLMREGKFKEAPFQEIEWNWDTEEKTLKDAVQGTLEGFRPGKGLFVFGDT